MDFFSGVFKNLRADHPSRRNPTERRERPLRSSRWCDDESGESYRETQDRLPSGSVVDVTEYGNGSKTVHFGGPAGSQDYDRFGNES